MWNYHRPSACSSAKWIMSCKIGRTFILARKNEKLILQFILIRLRNSLKSTMSSPWSPLALTHHYLILEMQFLYVKGCGSWFLKHRKMDFNVIFFVLTFFSDNFEIFLVHFNRHFFTAVSLFLICHVLSIVGLL